MKRGMVIWLKGVALGLAVVAVIWVVVKWNICEWHCYELGRFANHTTEGCQCLPPHREAP